ncbi:4-hydroxy-tetrahydrodipicolinate reductase [Subtercola boreus]|uniref:4-hydroxy-tetrahydrodipicolinate reductase n=1 Tax=Subtercola boreus TaxID=120213 RepID=A0A3E0WDF0_9MICO|nr:4-hydroxy-tetrahydrodipicolinate reductase [Subtercola boreus]RFA20819.1 4-hydroxy-tetrahydrodipicolinate reductase [Subtercola boreus]RFA20934.1 4-hydroxy-tetrahydrodipicolinate reductase [Subtercola boreus]RFA27127.1 4-hydroxy-tetrahydrodipicolinate reductase [Subtercola boreus]
MSTKVAIVGATGKMGQLAHDLLTRTMQGDEQEFEIVAELSSKDALEKMIGADVVFDVTVPGVSQSVVDFAVTHGIDVLVGTSGWSGDRILALEHRLAQTPTVGVVIVPNFSLGSVLATAFSAMAAQFFDSIEIVEAHGAGKVDSPSGTATRTAELIGAARAAVGPVSAPHTDQRARGQQVASVPVHSLRLSGVVAKQEVIFGGVGEVLTFSHETLSPTSYEAGILLGLRAATEATGVVVGLDKLIDLPRLLAHSSKAATP